MILKQEGASVGGTIQCTNVDSSFGAAPQPIRDGQLVANKLKFSATGQDGGLFSADFVVKADKIDGWGQHSGPGYNATTYFSLVRR